MPMSVLAFSAVALSMSSSMSRQSALIVSTAREIAAAMISPRNFHFSGIADHFASRSALTVRNSFSFGITSESTMSPTVFMASASTPLRLRAISAICGRISVSELLICSKTGARLTAIFETTEDRDDFILAIASSAFAIDCRSSVLIPILRFLASSIKARMPFSPSPSKGIISLVDRPKIATVAAAFSAAVGSFAIASAIARN